MENLTRDQAIKRIKDIINDKSCDHLRKWDHRVFLMSPFESRENRAILSAVNSGIKRGAIEELKAIFDITEEELK